MEGEGVIVYIAGKMTGLEDLGKQAFNDAEKTLKELGYTVLNPAVLPDGMRPEQYMPICMAMLEQADGIVLLNNWSESAGAQLERKYAKYQHKHLLYMRDIYRIIKESEKSNEG